MIQSGVRRANPDRLSFDAVTVDYGRSRVLSRVSFACRAGSLTGIFGPNGAGKSTLLRHACRPLPGFARARSSTVDGRGARAAAMRAAHRLARARSRALPGALRSREPALLRPAVRRRRSRPRASARPSTASASMRARHRSRRAAYSRGMMQRVGAGARAARTSRACVLLDEPFTGLDRAGACSAARRGSPPPSATAAPSSWSVVARPRGRIDELCDAVVVMRGGPWSRRCRIRIVDGDHAATASRGHCGR